MQRILLSALALAWLTLTTSPSAWAANQGMIPYKPGALKTAAQNGETVLLHYKSTW